jgi:hypothetical protein
MNPLSFVPAWLVDLVAGLGALALAATAGFYAGDKHAHAADKAKTQTAVIAATAKKDDDESKDREQKRAAGNQYAASAVAIAASAAAVDTGRMRYTCPRVNLPEAPTGRPPVDGTGSAASGVGSGSVDFGDTAREVVKLGAERDRLAAKVAGLQKTIRDQPGYTADKPPADNPDDRK